MRYLQVLLNLLFLPYILGSPSPPCPVYTGTTNTFFFTSTSTTSSGWYFLDTADGVASTCGATATTSMISPVSVSYYYEPLVDEQDGECYTVTFSNKCDEKELDIQMGDMNTFYLGTAPGGIMGVPTNSNATFSFTSTANMFVEVQTTAGTGIDCAFDISVTDSSGNCVDFGLGAPQPPPLPPASLAD